MRPSLPRNGWWRRLVQVAIATAILGLYFTLIGNWTMAFLSYAVGLTAAAGAAVLVKLGR